MRRSHFLLQLSPTFSSQHRQPAHPWGSRSAAPDDACHRAPQAVSILYKMQLPMVLVFNKTDVTKHDFALEWMRDFDTFHAALEDCSGYATDLSRSLSLVLDEFYTNVRREPARGCRGVKLSVNFFYMILPFGDDDNANDCRPRCAVPAQLRTVGVSAATGEGMDDLLRAVEARSRFPPQIPAPLPPFLAALRRAWR